MMIHVDGFVCALWNTFARNQIKSNESHLPPIIFELSLILRRFWTWTLEPFLMMSECDDFDCHVCDPFDAGTIANFLGASKAVVNAVLLFTGQWNEDGTQTELLGVSEVVVDVVLLFAGGWNDEGFKKELLCASEVMVDTILLVFSFGAKSSNHFPSRSGA